MKIYCIKNKKNKKMYIGQTTGTLKHRFAQHSHYDKTRHSAISNAIQKYGKENFEIFLLEECEDMEILNERERYWIDSLNTRTPNGYNIQHGGNGPGKHTEDAKRRIALGRTGYKAPPETIEKMRLAQRGKKMPEHVRKMQSERMMGNKYAEGKSCSDDLKQKIRDNTSSQPPKSKCGYKGVYWSKIEEKYGCRFSYKETQLWCGWFTIPENGARVYDIMNILKGPSHAFRNFPEKTLEELISELTEKASMKAMEIINNGG